MPSRVLSSAAPMMAGAPTDEELGLGSSRAAPHVAVGMPSVVVTQSPPHTGTQAQQLAAATGGTFSTLNPIHTAAVADDASGTAVYRLLAFLCAPAGVLDDCASCPRYVTWLIPWEALTFLLLASVFTAMVIRGTLGVGALFIPIILHRFIRLLLDVGMIICGIGPWSQAQNSGTMHSGVWLPRLMRLADGMGAGLTTLMASFLIAGSNIHAAVPTAGAGTPGRGRPAMALYKTLLFPMFLVCAAQLLVVVPTLIGYTACRLGLLSTSPGPLFGLVYTPRWRKAFSALAVQLCLLLLNAGTLPLCLKLDDYSSVSWGTVLVIPSLLVGLGLGCCALVTIGACTDYAVSAGRCGRRMRSAAVTATPWTVCKTLFAVFSISTACVSLMGLGSLLIRVSAELEKAEAVYLNPSNAGITSFLLLEGGTQSLVIPWCLSYGVACLGLWLVCTRILPAWRREFAHALGTLTPTSYARATQAALGQAWMGAEGGAGGVGQAGGSDSGSLHVRTLFLPVPSKLVRVGFTRYRRVRSLTSTAEQAQGGSSGSVALDDCQALSRGCAAADAEDDYKTWLTKAQLLLEARAGAKNAGADKKGHMQMNELKNASYDGSNGGEEMCIEMVSLPMPVPCRPLSAGAPERGPTGLEGHMDGERGDEGITVRMRRQGTSHVEAQSAEAAKPAAAEQAGEGLGVGHPFGSDPHTMQELQPLSPGPGQLPARAGFFASLRSPASADLRSLVSPGGTTTAAMNLSSGGGSGWASTGLGIGAAAIAAGSAAGTALPAWLSPRRARKGPTAAHKRTDEEEAAGAMDGLGGTTDCTAPAQTGNRTRSIGGALSGIIQALSPRVQSLAAAVGWPSVGPAAAAAWPCASTEGELESCLEAYVREAQEACECALCCEREIDTVLLECGHALCWCCAQKLPAHVASNTRRCPFCRTPISYAARLMLPDSLLAAALADPSAVAENHADSSSILEPEQLQHRLSCLHAVMSCHAVKLPRSSSTISLSDVRTSHTAPTTTTQGGRERERGRRSGDAEGMPDSAERQSIAARVRRLSASHQVPQGVPSPLRLGHSTGRSTQEGRGGRSGEGQGQGSRGREGDRRRERDRERALSAQRRAAYAGSTPRNPSLREQQRQSQQPVYPTPEHTPARYSRTGADTGTARGHGFGVSDAAVERANSGGMHRARSEGALASAHGRGAAPRVPQLQASHAHLVDSMPVISTRRGQQQRSSAHRSGPEGSHRGQAGGGRSRSRGGQGQGQGRTVQTTRSVRD